MTDVITPIRTHRLDLVSTTVAVLELNNDEYERGNVLYLPIPALREVAVSFGAIGTTPDPTFPTVGNPVEKIGVYTGPLVWPIQIRAREYRFLIAPPHSGVDLLTVYVPIVAEQDQTFSRSPLNPNPNLGSRF